MSRIRQRKQKVRHFREPNAGDMYLDAVSCGDAAVIEDYLDRNGRPEYADCKGQTALHIAVRHGHHSMLTALIRHFNSNQIDQRDMYGLSARKVAESLGDDEAEEIINNYLYELQTSPYVNKSYSFKKRAKKESLKSASIKKGSLKSASPNVWNMMYLPEKKESIKRSPIVYRNENKKQVYVQEKKTRKRAKVQPIIVQQNK
jgi:ankyrin repeat protein